VSKGCEKIVKDVEVADYVVVGAGSAGSIVAARLSAAGASVIVLESGGIDRRPDVTFPLGIMSLYATANWKYACAPDASKDTGAETFASGKIVGGSGSSVARPRVQHLSRCGDMSDGHG
jgi:choline dehydrogenase-like flavoprotein